MYKNDHTANNSLKPSLSGKIVSTTIRCKKKNKFLSYQYFILYLTLSCDFVLQKCLHDKLRCTYQIIFHFLKYTFR